MSTAPPPYNPPRPKDTTPSSTHDDVPTEEPPAYSQLEPNTLDPNDPMPPATFSLHGRFIHASTTSSDPSYQTNHPILTLTHGSRQIDFQRVQHKYKTSNTTGQPVISHRGKDIYTLAHHLPILGMPFQAVAVPKSRKTLGEIHIAKAPVFHTGYRANRVLPEQEVARLERKGEKVPREYHWQMKEAGGGKGEEAWEWKDGDGRTVAVQWKERSDVGGQPGSSRDPNAGDKGGWVPKLQVLVELDRRTLDSLVAVWCLWVIHLHHEATKPKKTWEDRMSSLARKRPEGTPQGGFYAIKF
ncbi:hypothetical protein QBC36DRAFT_229257 [Triangularia setosa]|uniref:Uncharacterized protein n=1 Tax=Triangularia setosa TaxID=2587417 RepID=A0AAN6WG81_9PEZI|nr:hypothetical protein QBC36DRAFT_229257 [Podospora setosa]